MVFPKDYQTFLAAGIILLVSSLVPTSSFHQKLDNELLASSASVDVSSLQKALQGKSWEEGISYLRDTFGETNVQPFSFDSSPDLAPSSPLTGQFFHHIIFREFKELWPAIERLYNGLNSPASKSLLNRKIEQLLKLFTDRRAFCQAIGREIATLSASHHPPTGIGKKIWANDRINYIEILKLIKAIFCDPPGGKPPTFLPKDYVFAKAFERLLERLRNPFTGQNPSLQRVPVLGPGQQTPPLEPIVIPGASTLGTAVAITGAVLLIIAFVICGQWIVLAIVVAAKIAVAALATKAATVGIGSALALLLLQQTARAQGRDYVTQQDVEEVNTIIERHQRDQQFIDDLRRRLGYSCPDYVRTMTEQKNIKDDPLTFSTDTLPRAPQTPGGCSRDPNYLNNVLHGFLLTAGNAYLNGVVIYPEDDLLVPGLATLTVTAASPGIRIGQDIPPQVQLKQQFFLDLTEFCRGKPEGDYPFEINLQGDGSYQSCNPFTLKGVVHCSDYGYRRSVVLSLRDLIERDTPKPYIDFDLDKPLPPVTPQTPSKSCGPKENNVCKGTCPATTYCDANCNCQPKTAVNCGKPYNSVYNICYEQGCPADTKCRLADCSCQPEPKTSTRAERAGAGTS